MKLSQLRAMVESIAAHSPAGADPNVRFWIPRAEGMPAGPKDSTQFVEFDIQAGANINDMVWSNRVVAVCGDVLPQKGDFDIPIAPVPFYR